MSEANADIPLGLDRHREHRQAVRIAEGDGHDEDIGRFLEKARHGEHGARHGLRLDRNDQAAF